MKVLIALPVQYKSFTSIDAIVDGSASCSGTDGAMVRLANLLTEAGIEVHLSAAFQIPSERFPCVQHSSVEVDKFDYLIAHQSHWDGTSLTFGNNAVRKTVLWLHNHIHQTLVHTFLQAGGCRVVCPSKDHANTYRALPGWRKKVAVIYNSYSSVFRPDPSVSTANLPKTRLLFMGAVTPEKGFVELTQIWTYLVERQVELDLAVAGSINLHNPNAKLGAMGVGESEFERTVIQPWLKTLPDAYQPTFLGALSPQQLQAEIAHSWAVIVNPSYRVPETFCVAAVDAQACDRTVFSVSAGALSETIYRGTFTSLVTGEPVTSVSERIIAGLSQRELVAENGKLAGEFIRQKFDSRAICADWIDLLTEHKTSFGLSESWDNPRSLMCDLIRWSGTWNLINHYRDQSHRQIVSKYKQFKLNSPPEA